MPRLEVESTAGFKVNIGALTLEMSIQLYKALLDRAARLYAKMQQGHHGGMTRWGVQARQRLGQIL